jgi:hypothetical protein
MPLAAVAPLRAGGGWVVMDTAGCCLPLRVAEMDGWRLLALSGGRPLPVAGEWDGERLELLSAWTGDQLALFGSEPNGSASVSGAGKGGGA